MKIKIKYNLDLRIAKNLLRYDGETGNFYRKVKRYKYKAGEIAGSLDKQGYICIKFNGEYWKAHRLAWAFVYGELPQGLIDHIDRNPQNNRIENLRIVSSRQNSQNRKNKFVGTHFCNRRKHWIASANINGKCVYIGQSKDRKVAHSMYLEKIGELPW